jgi:hypothetical protein
MVFELLVGVFGLVASVQTFIVPGVRASAKPMCRAAAAADHVGSKHLRLVDGLLPFLSRVVQHHCGAHILCGPQLLWGLVELVWCWGVLAQVEQTSAQLPQDTSIRTTRVPLWGEQTGDYHIRPFVSAVAHEVVVSIPLRTIDIYELHSFGGMMAQVPLVLITKRLSPRLGNIMFWISIMIG